MKAYVVTTAVAFALIVIAHIARVISEGIHLATEPFFIIVTAVPAALCIWAVRLLMRPSR